MNETTSNLLTVCAATVLLAVALSACGGGGDGPMTGGETMPPDGGGMVSVVTEFGDDGLIAGPGASPEAMGPVDTLASVALRGEDFVPVLSPVKFDSDGTNSGVVLLEEDDQAYVKSVAIDGPSGFTLTYVVNGQETEVQFGPEHVTRTDEAYGHFTEFSREVDNAQFLVWSAPTFSPLQPVHRDYFTLAGWQVGYDFRGYASVGVLTSPERLTSGGATYEGQVVADLWNNFLTPDSFDDLVRFWGALSLDADFSAGEISGKIDYLEVEPAGTAYSNCCWEQLSVTTYIEILPGSIAGNRFHADWIGREPNASTDWPHHVRGFDGSLLGEFYGPNGEEAGGVITGQREERNQFINGRFGAEKTVEAQAAEQ